MIYYLLLHVSVKTNNNNYNTYYLFTLFMSLSWWRTMFCIMY